MKVYIKINGELHDTGRRTMKESPMESITVDKDHVLSIKSRTWPMAAIQPIKDGVVCLELNGEFTDSDIMSLKRDPWQIFKPR